ncbi:MAG: aspartyl protease family protein [Proteobacteria bacterium]|nr:aspartyl protease family protein [Pseudomonadota bacterium]
MKSALAALTMYAAMMTAGAAWGQADTARAILDANHKAVGDLPAAGTARLAYDYRASGLDGTQSTMIDLATGAYANAQESDDIPAADGYDGKVPWQMDISRSYTTQLGGDRLALAINGAYRNANRWWRDDFGDAIVTYAGREVVDGHPRDHLVVTPKGGKRFDAWFDADTHLLAGIAEDRQFFHMRESYSDYRPVDGALVTHTIVVDPGVGEDGLVTAKLKHATFGPAQPLSAYGMPRPPLTGATIVGGAPSTTVPFRLLNNHIYVQATVNGKGPYTFIVDTGGHTLLSSRIVNEVGLQPVGKGVESGAGEGHGTTGFVHYDEIAIGDVRLRDQMGFATEIYDKSIEGIPVDGMVGYELLRRMVTTIDYEHRTMTFTDPAHFVPGANLGVAVPFEFYDHLPFVVGSIDGRPATFDIDTGSRSEIDLTGPYVAKYDLRARYPKGTLATTGWGVGGPARAYVVRLPSLKLGPVAVDNIAAGLSDMKAGSFSDPNYDANIGTALLKRFVVTFDYAHQVMYLRRIVPTPADVGTFDRSGLWFNAKADGYEITDVARDSAGAKAGLAVGDVITAIDGKPVTPEGLSDARRRLRSDAAGTAVALTVRHGGTERGVTLTLADQI